MPFFITLLIFAAVSIVAELLRPKPKFEDARPAGLGDFNFPTATEGRSVPLIWGTVRLKAPNVVWYGNLRQSAITEKVKTGLFSSDTVTTGYRYSVGIQFALCRGPVTSCTGVRINDRFADGGRTGKGSMAINAPTILGGEDFGQGGVVGSIGEFYVGDTTQDNDIPSAGNGYLTGVLSPADVPGYRGTCYYVFFGLVGTSPNIPPWSFDVQRIPDGLSLATEQPGDELISTSECNPMNVLYEIMTDTDWGLKIPTGRIDIPNFRAAAGTVAGEENGFSFVLDNEKESSEVINEVLRQIDAALYFDRNAGLWRVTLIRDDYVLADQPLFDESNIVSLDDYGRTTWSETSNQVRLLFDDTDDNFKQAYALAQDMANVEIQGGNISAEVRYPGCKKRVLANKLVWRELGTLAYPLAKHTVIFDREGFNLVPGSVFRWSWARLGITELAMRVNRISFGTLNDGTVRVTAVQDIFATPGPGTFGDPTPTGWDGAEDSPVVVVAADTLAFEAPRQLVVQDPFAPGQQPRVWIGARTPGGGTVGFSVYTRIGTGPGRPTGIFEDDFSINDFLVAGKLTSALDGYETSYTRPWTANIGVTGDPDDLSSVRSVSLFFRDSEANVSSLRNIAYIDGEFIGYEDATESSGDLTLIGVHRGLFHTAPKDHAINTRVWFISNGGNLNTSTLAAAEDEMDLKMRSRSQFEIISEAATPTTEFSFNADRIWSVPLAPRDPVLNSVYADATSVSVDVDYSTETSLPLEDARGIEVGITPRDWRELDVVLDENLGNDWVDDSPNFDYELVLDPGGTPATTTAINEAGTSSGVADVYLLRTAMIEALGANTSFPTTARLDVTAKHTPVEVGSEVTNPVKMQHDFTITSSLVGADDLVFGAFAVSAATSTAVIIGTTGTFGINIYTALPSSGIVEININGGGFATLVAAAATTGSVGVTAADSVVLRFSQAPANDQFFLITGSGGSTEQGYGVFLS